METKTNTKWCPTCERRKDASLFVRTGKGAERCTDCLEKRKAVNARINSERSKKDV